MRIGIFSDIHGNLEALKAVSEAMKDDNLDRRICLGDVVGYGASPNECCELVREFVDQSILGNHDAAVAGRMDYEYYYEAARRALDWSRNHLSREHLHWLEDLPYTRREEDILYCHGSPLSPEDFDYIFAPEQARTLLEIYAQLPQVTFIGHSHLYKSFALTSSEVQEVPARQFGIRRDNKYVISDGSVGQPRDYDNRAGYIVYDDQAKTIDFRRLDYDIQKAAEKIILAGLPPSFAKRLFLGV